MVQFKPQNYNSVSPYFVVRGAEEFIQWLEKVFAPQMLRRVDSPEGNLIHAELKIDDSVIMVGEAGEHATPNSLMVHVYVSDVNQTFQKAVATGCEVIQKPNSKKGEPDRRGGFKDFYGNQWFIATQL